MPFRDFFCDELRATATASDCEGLQRGRGRRDGGRATSESRHTCSSSRRIGWFFFTRGAWRGISICINLDGGCIPYYLMRKGGWWWEERKRAPLRRQEGRQVARPNGGARSESSEGTGQFSRVHHRNRPPSQPRPATPRRRLLARARALFRPLSQPPSPPTPTDPSHRRPKTPTPVLFCRPRLLARTLHRPATRSAQASTRMCCTSRRGL
jgi:hypothetical protein